MPIAFVRSEFNMLAPHSWPRNPKLASFSLNSPIEALAWLRQLKLFDLGGKLHCDPILLDSLSLPPPEKKIINPQMTILASQSYFKLIDMHHKRQEGRRTAITWLLRDPKWTLTEESTHFPSMTWWQLKDKVWLFRDSGTLNEEQKDTKQCLLSAFWVIPLHLTYFQPRSNTLVPMKQARASTGKF